MTGYILANIMRFMFDFNILGVNLNRFFSFHYRAGMCTIFRDILAVVIAGFVLGWYSLFSFRLNFISGIFCKCFSSVTTAYKNYS